ncbi:hypothetical protein JVT61DRAFT_9587 [Boletus reticuloceps]|uniref:Uncharacterized protein n=1 Tax=Boletus reticuloceps TaxID=495285 RepID=A0A8I3A6B1_9AGAM|nr:hypothetical protein JVT61DRAFT_9587 [Boletus reticuloceps]
MMCKLEDRNLETFSDYERKEYSVFCELLKLVPSLESRLSSSDEEDVVAIAELIQRGTNGARADDMKGMKCTIIDWITLKGQMLNPHIPHHAKSARGFNHKRTGALLCPAGYDWSNAEIKEKLCNGQLRVTGNQWPIFLYANYAYNTEDPWNGLLHSGIFISAYKYIFTSPSSVDLEEPKATHSCNARIHRMHSVTKASITYVAIQVSCSFALTSAQVFSRTDLLTDSEWFYNSILELLYDPDERHEVNQLLQWWNRQIFPANAESAWLPSKNSMLATIRRRRVAFKAVAAMAGGVADSG